MISATSQDTDLRDGIETMPELADVQAELLHPQQVNAEQDADLDEALMETFPASDPIASGKTA